jgi:hypothetical protein
LLVADPIHSAAVGDRHDPRCRAALCRVEPGGARPGLPMNACCLSTIGGRPGRRCEPVLMGTRIYLRCSHDRWNPPRRPGELRERRHMCRIPADGASECRSGRSQSSCARSWAARSRNPSYRCADAASLQSEAASHTAFLPALRNAATRRDPPPGRGQPSGPGGRPPGGNDPVAPPTTSAEATGSQGRSGPGTRVASNIAHRRQRRGGVAPRGAQGADVAGGRCWPSGSRSSRRSATGWRASVG